MNELKNPWDEMGRSMQRRISSELNHDLFWITDNYGNYGLSIESKYINDQQNEIIELKGFNIYLENLSETTRLYLVLVEKSEWEIFYCICKDLVNAAETLSKGNDERKLIPILNTRLLRWREILQKDSLRMMSIEQQMGLFGELNCLYDFAKTREVRDSVIAWVGCESGKQDFLFDSLAVEVKSKRSSSGNKVHISSLEQLHCDKTPLYLLVYSLTNADSGDSIQDMVEKIKLIIQEGDLKLSLNFERKLMDYGYVYEIQGEHLLKFVIDKKQVYFVSDTFPKINPHSLFPQIKDIRYSVDLSHCEEHKFPFEELFN